MYVGNEYSSPSAFLKTKACLVPTCDGLHLNPNFQLIINDSFKYSSFGHGHEPQLVRYHITKIQMTWVFQLFMTLTQFVNMWVEDCEARTDKCLAFCTVSIISAETHSVVNCASASVK